MAETIISAGIDDDIVLRRDRVLLFLNKIFNGHVILIGLFFPFAASVMVPWAIFTGVWDGIHYPLSISYSTYIGDIFLGCVNGLIIKYYRSMPRAINLIVRSNIITCSRACGKSHVDEIAERFSSRWGLLVYPFSLVITVVVHLSYLSDDLHGWTEVSATGGWSALGWYHMGLFFAEVSVILNFVVSICIFTSVLWLTRLCHGKGCLEYNFNMTCFYRSGGLKPIGDVVMEANTIFFTIGIYLSSVVFTVITYYVDNVGAGANPLSWMLVELMLPIPLYMLFCPAIFIIQLFPVHRLMREKKRFILESVFSGQEIYPSVKKNPPRRAGGDIVGKMDVAFGVYEKLMHLPEWPFDIATVMKLLSTTIAPALPVLGQQAWRIFHVLSG